MEHNQIGWVKALPKIRFDIMNTANRSTGFTPFQLHFGHSPQLLPPLFPCVQKTLMETLAQDLLDWMQNITYMAQDNLISAKVSQAFQANKSHSVIFPFKIGDCVVLSMLHCHHEFRANDPNCITKFMPRFDGPFFIEDTDEKHSTVTLDLPNLPSIFPVFHMLKIHPFTENDNFLFPSHALVPPYPIMIDGQQEFFIDKIVDGKKCGKKILYQVHCVKQAYVGIYYATT